MKRGGGERKNTNREGWTKREEFIENVLRRNEEKKGTARTDAAALEDVVAMEENEIEDEAVLAMLRKSARAAMLAEQEMLENEEEEEDNSDLAAYYNYINAVKANASLDGAYRHSSYVDEDEIEAKLESIQGLLDVLREEHADDKKTDTKLESLQNIMDQVYSFREEQQQLTLVPEIVVSDALDEDETGGNIFRADSVKRKRKKAMNKHKHRKRKKKDRFKNK